MTRRTGVGPGGLTRKRPWGTIQDQCITEYNSLNNCPSRSKRDDDGVRRHPDKTWGNTVTWVRELGPAPGPGSRQLRASSVARWLLIKKLIGQ